MESVHQSTYKWTQCTSPHIFIAHLFSTKLSLVLLDWWIHNRIGGISWNQYNQHRMQWVKYKSASDAQIQIVVTYWY